MCILPPSLARRYRGGFSPVAQFLGTGPGRRAFKHFARMSNCGEAAPPPHAGT